MSPNSVESGSLLAHFESLEDPRVEYLVEYRLLDIIEWKVAIRETFRKTDRFRPCVCPSRDDAQCL